MSETGAKLSDSETRFWAELTEALGEDDAEYEMPDSIDEALAAELAEIYAANSRAAEERLRGGV